MNKRQARIIEVSEARAITPHMVRIVFAGAGLNDFPPDYKSGYIKFLFTPEGQAIQNEAEVDALAPLKPTMRTYTIREFDAVKKELTVDFASHPGTEGPASKWALQAKPGDNILIRGPGPVKLVDNTADWVLLAGDMTALPAISCNLEQLPASAKGYAILEVSTEADRQELACPAGVAVLWVAKNNDATSQAFIDAVQNVEWLQGRPSIWCACEFSVMRALRKHFKIERQVDRKALYISSYWKAGFTEDQHKVAKQADAQA